MEKVPVTAVLWDFGGVITTSPFDAFSAYEAANGLDPGFIRRLNATNPDTNAWARFERSELSPAEFAKLFEAEAAAAGGTVDAVALLSLLRTELRPSMLSALDRCRGRVKTALLTNNFLSGDAADGEGPYADVLGRFDAVIESSRVGHRKPDPRFYEIACEELEIEPEEAVFLDDLGVNLKPARAMGMKTIKVVDPDEALAELQELLPFPIL
jgi:putative hydrolase of the HAD superfamily